MIYVVAGDRKLIILEPENIDLIKAGLPARSPDNSVFVAYTPDAVWLRQQIERAPNPLTLDEMEELFNASKGRPEVRRQTSA